MNPINWFASENMERKRRLVSTYIAYLTHFIIYVEKYTKPTKIPT
jgi:hypothetical protein